MRKAKACLLCRNCEPGFKTLHVWEPESWVVLWHWLLRERLPHRPVSHHQMQPGGMFAAVIAGRNQARADQRHVEGLNETL